MTKGRFLKRHLSAFKRPSPGAFLIPILENIPSNTKIKGCS